MQISVERSIARLVCGSAGMDPQTVPYTIGLLLTHATCSELFWPIQPSFNSPLLLPATNSTPYSLLGTPSTCYQEHILYLTCDSPPFITIDVFPHNLAYDIDSLLSTVRPSSFYATFPFLRGHEAKDYYNEETGAGMMEFCKIAIVVALALSCFSSL